jgi:hypothetical protein
MEWGMVIASVTTATSSEKFEGGDLTALSD